MWKPMELIQLLTFRSMKEGIIDNVSCEFDVGWVQKHVYFQ